MPLEVTVCWHRATAAGTTKQIATASETNPTATEEGLLPQVSFSPVPFPSAWKLSERNESSGKAESSSGTGSSMKRQDQGEPRPDLSGAAGVSSPRQPPPAPQKRLPTQLHAAGAQAKAAGAWHRAALPGAAGTGPWHHLYRPARGGRISAPG